MSIRPLAPSNEKRVTLSRPHADEILAGRPPASEASIKDVFAGLGASPTRDVMALYKRIDGMAEPDASGWRLWPLGEIARRNARSDHPSIAFSDYLDGACIFRLQRVDGQASAVAVKGDENQVAWVMSTSLRSFVRALTTHRKYLRALLEE